MEASWESLVGEEGIETGCLLARERETSLLPRKPLASADMATLWVWCCPCGALLLGTGHT